VPPTRKKTSAALAGSFRQTFSELLKARHPVLLVESYEEDRVVDEIVAIAGDSQLVRTPRQVRVWSATSGLAAPGETGPAGTRSPQAALEEALRATEPTVFVMKDLHHYLGSDHRPADPVLLRLLRDAAAAFQRSPQPSCLILLSPALSLPADVEKDVTIVDFPIPDATQLRGVLDGMIEANKGRARIAMECSDDDLERLTKAALGLTLHEAENAFARAMVERGSLSADDVAVVAEQKAQTIRKSGILEVVAATGSVDDIGGLENLKRWLAKRDGSWLDSAAAWGLPSPKGVLVTGVPGCGKSLTAKCTASMWGLPLLRMDVGRVFAGLVGSSEQNMRTALRTAEAVAPVVLWIDEIEKGFAGMGGPSGDSGTSQRVFGTFLTWLQEKTKPVFVFATANNIDRLPPEFLRKGRFDEIFFVDLPTDGERVPIWRVHLTKRLESEGAGGKLTVDDALLADLVGRSEGYSGAEIEQAVIAALYDAFAERRPLEHSDLGRAIETMVPLSVTQAEQIRALREWADVRAVAATAAEDRDDYEHPGPAAAGPAPGEVAPADGVNRARGGRTVDF
jgi:ATP-dependent 26S proteasome regulatory subunit